MFAQLSELLDYIALAMNEMGANISMNHAAIENDAILSAGGALGILTTVMNCIAFPWMNQAGNIVFELGDVLRELGSALSSI